MTPFSLGVLESPEDFESSEELFDAVGGVLLESLGASKDDEDKVREVCEQLYNVLCGGGDVGDLGDSEDDAMAKLLDAPVHLASKLKDEGVQWLLLCLHKAC